MKLKKIISTVLIIVLFCGEMSQVQNVNAEENADKTIKSVSLVMWNSAAITETGDLYCWGNAPVGNGTITDQSTPVKVLGNVKSVSLGAGHSAAITETGDLYCWGINDGGEVGNGTTTNQTAPVKVLGNVKNVTLGYDHSAAITETGDLYCWGFNEYGQVGNGTTTDQSTPVKVLGNVKNVTLGYDHSAAITETGDLYCWGFNEYGQVGNGTTTDQSTPVKVLGNVKSVSLDVGYSAAITETGDLYCWGANYDGQVGNGTTTDQSTPVKVLGNVKSVSLGNRHSAAITETGDLYCWGANYDGQVGNGTTTNQSTPVKILLNGEDERTTIWYGRNSATLGSEITGTEGSTINTLLVLDSNRYEIADLDVKPLDTTIVEVLSTDIGSGDYITSGNEKKAVVHLKLKKAGRTDITVTAPDGTNISVPVTVTINNYEIKLYSSVSAMIVGKGKAIGAAVQLENNGEVVEDYASYSIISSNTDIVTADHVRNESDGTYFNINGVNEGTAKLTITELNTGAVYSANVQVNSGILTYNAEALPKYYDRDYEYNGYIGGMFVDSFSSYKKDNGKMAISFNVYNTMNLVGAVDVYDADGILFDTAEIKRFDGGCVTSLKDTVIEGGWLIADLFNGNFLTYKQASYSKKTEINIDVPVGGHIEITNDPTYSETCAIYNTTEFIVDSIMLFGGVLDIKADTDTKEKIAQNTSDNIVKKFVKSYVDAVKGKTPKDKIANLGKKFTEKLSEKAAKGVLKSSIEGELASFVDEGKAILKDGDIDLEKIIIQSAGDIGISIAESTLKKAMGPFGNVLNGMFTFSEYVDYSTFFVNLCKKHEMHSFNIYFDGENGCLCDNGISIKSGDGKNSLSENNFVMHSIVLSNTNDLSNAMKSSLDRISNDYIVRDIYLERDGKISQPGQSVQVTIPIPDGYNENQCKLYWVRDDGTLVEMACTISNGNILFYTDHFSYYAIVQIKEEETSEKTTEEVTTEASETSAEETITKEQVTIRDGQKAGTGTAIQPMPSKIKKIRKAKKSLKITWKKVRNVKGYQIQYSTSSKFKKSKKITIKKAKTTSRIIKKLKARKRYYVRIRTYITVHGKMYYSKWSMKKSQKTK